MSESHVFRGCNAAEASTCHSGPKIESVQLVHGDKLAFNIFTRRYSDGVTRYAAFLVGSGDQAKRILLAVPSPTNSPPPAPPPMYTSSLESLVACCDAAVDAYVDAGTNFFYFGGERSSQSDATAAFKDWNVFGTDLSLNYVDNAETASSNYKILINVDTTTANNVVFLTVKYNNGGVVTIFRYDFTSTEWVTELGASAAAPVITFSPASSPTALMMEAKYAGADPTEPYEVGIALVNEADGADVNLFKIVLEDAP